MRELHTSLSVGKETSEMERSIVKETVAGVILRGIVATVGLETTFNLLAEIEKEGKEVWVTPKGVPVDFPVSECKEKEIPLNEKEKENKYPTEEEQVVIARDAILSLLKDGKTHRKTTSLYKICKEKILEYKPVWSAYTFLEKEGLLETTVIDRVKFATITPHVVAEPGTVILPSEGPEYKRPSLMTPEKIERAKECILENLALEKSPVMKSKFLRRTTEKYKLSYSPMWKACNELIEGGKVCVERIHSRKSLISLPKPSLPPLPSWVEKGIKEKEDREAYESLLTTPVETPVEKKPHEKKLYKGVDNRYRSKSGLTITESVEKCEEIILRYLNLQSSKPDGLPKEHLVALCMFENFAHSYARKAISNLIETGKAKFSMNDSQGVQVPFVTLNEEEK